MLLVLFSIVFVLCAQHNALARLQFYRDSLSSGGSEETVFLPSFEQVQTLDDEPVLRREIRCRWKLCGAGGKKFRGLW